MDMAADNPVHDHARILLIDDDRVYAIWVAHVLRRRGGFELTHVLAAAEGLRRAETEPWDLVITDIEMPDMRGPELIERIRREDSSLAIAVVTAHASTEPAVAALPSSVQVLAKPMSADAFLDTVTALVRRGREARQPR
jgi:DNA-binding response OmpR family regulator